VAIETAWSDDASTPHRLISRRPAREVVPADPTHTARWHVHDYPSPVARWNHHPEYEVHLIRSSTGRYIVGDRIDLFGPGQLVLVGSHLPHHWISDLEPGQRVAGRDVVFQFHPRWVAQCRTVLPELVGLDGLLTRSRRGIEFTGASAVAGARELEAIGVTTGVTRIRHVFGLLEVLASAPPSDQVGLAKQWLPPIEDRAGADVVDRVLTYVLANLTGRVRLSTAAGLVGMSESALSKLFSRVSGQSFSATITGLRLARACQLLELTTLPVGVIHRRTGYTNLSNFNRQFLARAGVTPTAYRAGRRAPP